MKTFPVKYRGEVCYVLVDDDDAERVEIALSKNLGHRGARKLSYVPAWKNRGFRPAIWCDGRLVYLSRWLLGVTDKDKIVDHIDQNPLNNRRANLRVTDRSGNAMNSIVAADRPYKTSKYRGVRAIPNRGESTVKRWAAEIAVRKKLIYLGTFDSERDAAIARDIAAERYHGEFAVFNIPKGER